MLKLLDRFRSKHKDLTPKLSKDACESMIVQLIVKVRQMHFYHV